jgi:hypothetical protein
LGIEREKEKKLKINEKGKTHAKTRSHERILDT